MLFSSSLSSVFVPTFQVLVDAAPLPLPIAKSISALSVQQRLNDPSHFEFRVNDPSEAASALFGEGRSIEISLGYVGQLQVVLTGEISSLSFDFPSNGPVTIEVEGFDFLHRATRPVQKEDFVNILSDKDLLRKIANEIGLGLDDDLPQPSPQPQSSNPQQQSLKSGIGSFSQAIDILRNIASRYNRGFWVDATTLYVKKTIPAPSVDLIWRSNLISFSTRLSTAGQPGQVTVRGWNPLLGWNAQQKTSVQQQTAAMGTATLSPAARLLLSPAGVGQIEGSWRPLSKAGSQRLPTLEENRPEVNSAQEAQSGADAIKARHEAKLLTGSGTTFGNPDIRAGSVLRISNIGRFSRHYLVREATHTINDSGYQTSFSVQWHQPEGGPSHVG